MRRWLRCPKLSRSKCACCKGWRDSTWRRGSASDGLAALLQRYARDDAVLLEPPSADVAIVGWTLGLSPNWTNCGYTLVRLRLHACQHACLQAYRNSTWLAVAVAVFSAAPANVDSATALTDLKRSATRGLRKASMARRAHVTSDHAGAPNVFSPLYVMSGE